MSQTPPRRQLEILRYLACGMTLGAAVEHRYPVEAKGVEVTTIARVTLAAMVEAGWIVPDRDGYTLERDAGGTWVNSSGYVMVLVGKEHPMASCRAYAKRCRLVCYETHGPPPDGYHAHHLNGDKQDDRPENLEWREPSDHSRYHLTSERARKLGAKGGRQCARLKRRAKREARRRKPLQSAP